MMSAAWVSPSSTQVLPASGLLRSPLAAVLWGLVELATPATRWEPGQLGAAGLHSVSPGLWDTALQRCPVALQPAVLLPEEKPRYPTVPPTSWGLCHHPINWPRRHPGCS